MNLQDMEGNIELHTMDSIHRPDTASLELAGSSGVWLTAFAWPDAYDSCGGWASRWFCVMTPPKKERGVKATAGKCPANFTIQAESCGDWFTVSKL